MCACVGACVWACVCVCVNVCAWGWSMCVCVNVCAWGWSMCVCLCGSGAGPPSLDVLSSPKVRKGRC